MRKIAYFSLVVSLLAVVLLHARAQNARPQVGEKQDSAVTPNAPTGPKPRNAKDEIYRGPPSNWDEGRLIVETESSASKEEHPNKSKSKE